MKKEKLEKLTEEILNNDLSSIPDLIDTNKLMSLFGIRRRLTIYEWNNKGYLNPIKIGRRNFYRKKDVARFMAEKSMNG